MVFGSRSVDAEGKLLSSAYPMHAAAAAAAAAALARLSVLVTVQVTGGHTIVPDGLDCHFSSSLLQRVSSRCDSLQVSYLLQRFSNRGPRTRGGPRRVPRGSARGFRKVVIVCTVSDNLRPTCFQICTHKSVTQCIAWKFSA